MKTPHLTPSIDQLPSPTEPPRSLWSDALARLRTNALAVFGFWVFLTITLFCYIGPIFHPHEPEAQQRSLRATPPFAGILEYDDAFGKTNQIAVQDFLTRHRSASVEVQQALESDQRFEYDGTVYRPSNVTYVFGTDAHGRDLMARIMQGGRISLGVGFLATLISLAIGVTYGSVSGYHGGRLDAFMMRAVEILYSLPFTIFVILLMVLFGRSIIMIFVAIGAVEWLTMARITRNSVLQLKEQEFALAAKATGVPTRSIIWRHMIPNLIGPVVVYATLSIPAIMILESILSFLGLGVQPPNASWGSLIADGAQKMTTYPWLLFVPAAFFSLTLFAMNFLGDGLRDALDVRTAKD